MMKMYLWYVNKVVDARAGPGMKSMTKFKSKNKKASDKDNTCEKIEKIMKKKKRKLEREASPALSDRSESKEDTEMTEVDFFAESATSGSSRTASPGGSDCEDNAPVAVSRRHKAQAKRRETLPEISGFVDLNFWKPEKVCCGTIFKGPNGEVLIDPRFLKPCEARLAKNCKGSDSPSDEKTSVDQNSKTYSDSSSDSGYDESSNPGAEKDSAFKKDEFLIKSELSISPIQVGN